MTRVCFDCGSLVEGIDSPGRSDNCPACDAPLHCCLNCRFYEPGVYNECRESQAERVLIKDKANFCDFFCFRSLQAGEVAASKKKNGKRENPLDALFKK